MKKIALFSVVASSVLMAGGYKIPEVSLNAIALSSANVAHAHGADASYYNPANMVFMKDENVLENDFTYIGLGDNNYKGNYTYAASLGGATIPLDTKAKKENFIVPSLFYVSGDVDGARFGLSIATPAGLSKRWQSQPAKGHSEEFTLETVEINPSIALPINDKLAVAIGIRVVHTTGVVKLTPVDGVISQDMEGDSIDFGYNLALSYKPTSQLEIGLTYRSKIDLTVEGDADLTYLPAGFSGNYDVSVEVPIPALFSAAVAYTFATNTTVEFVYDRNFWHSYSEIDFDYKNTAAEFIFGGADPKKWKDVNSYRLGITQELDEVTLMCGIVYDETPIPDATLGFELPDSDSLTVSLGGRYQINEKMNVGLSALYSFRDDRTVSNDTLDGEFTDGSALLISAGLEYKF